MNRLLNYIIALLVPSLASCSMNSKVQDVPEEIYACPMPGDWQDEEPEEPDTLVIETQKNDK